MDPKRFLSSAAVWILFIALLAGCGVVVQPSLVALPTGPDAGWNNVVIGDNSMWGHGKAIANQIETDQGIQVT